MANEPKTLTGTIRNGLLWVALSALICGCQKTPKSPPPSAKTISPFCRVSQTGINTFSGEWHPMEDDSHVYIAFAGSKVAADDWCKGVLHPELDDYPKRTIETLR